LGVGGHFKLGGRLARGHVGKGRGSKGSARVQIGAELLCKSAKVIVKG
jgi:hypothetical protein